MADMIIEFNRGQGWLVRLKGKSSADAATLATMLPEYAVQYPHRAFLNGVLVAEAYPPKKPIG